MSGILSDNIGRSSGLVKAAGGGGAWNIVSTQSVSAVASVEFTGIDSTADTWCVIMQGVNVATDNTVMRIRTSNDTSSHSYDSGSDYSWSAAGFYYGGVYDPFSLSDTSIGMGTDPLIIGNDADIGVSGFVYIHKPADTALDTGITYNIYQQNGSNNFQNIVGGGNRAAAEAVTAIQFFCASGNIDSGRFTLYKIAHA